MPAEGMPSMQMLTSWFFAPSSTRATSRSRAIWPSAVGLDDDVGELLRLGQPAERGHRVLEVDARGGGLLADLAGRHLDVLLPQRPDHVAGGHVARGQLVGIEPDPHAVVLLAEDHRVAHALEPRQLVAD